MTMVVLRVDGEHLDVEQCLTWIPETAIEAVWRVGERRVGSKISATSGFNLLLSDNEDALIAVEEAMRVFLSLAPRIAALVQSGATAEVDFALFIEAMSARSIRLDPGVLRAVGQHGVSLVVSAYPCADPEDSPTHLD
ncbi:hypothetical protein WME75_13175 [Sorangium sp. So ce1014]|uniref:hypothetical protein n=1 Tax=Sorangium sp. So ce1014 TaxID=3133326 RepID=UPI003F5E3448